MQFRSWASFLMVCLVITQVRASDQRMDDAVESIRTGAGDHRLILLGEMHGTRQIPALVGKLVAAYAAEGPALLGLEVHTSEHGAMHRYLASDGGAQSRADLLASPFWKTNGVQHDGRRNYGTIDLIEQVRQLRVQGRDVAIVPYDNSPNHPVDSQARDEDMAFRLRAAYAALPRGRLLVLSGNVHAMLQRPSYAPEQMQTPMGSYLRDLNAYSVNITANGGEFWACMARCGPVAMQSSDRVTGRVGGGVHDFEVVLPMFTLARLIGMQGEP